MLILKSKTGENHMIKPNYINENKLWVGGYKKLQP